MNGDPNYFSAGKLLKLLGGEAGVGLGNAGPSQ